MFKRILFGAFVSLLLSSAAHTDLFEDVQNGNWEAVHKVFFRSLQDQPTEQFQTFLSTDENGVSLYDYIFISGVKPDDHGYAFYSEILDLYNQLCIAYEEKPNPESLNLDNLQFRELMPLGSIFGGFGSASDSAPILITRSQSDSTNFLKGPTRGPREAMRKMMDDATSTTTVTSTTNNSPSTPLKAQIFTSSLPTLSSSDTKRESGLSSVRKIIPKRSKSAEERSNVITNDLPSVTVEESQTDLARQKSSSQELLRKILGRRSKSAPENSNTVCVTEIVAETLINSLGHFSIAEPKTEFEVGELTSVDSKQNGDVHLHFKTQSENDQVILVPKDPKPLGTGRQGSVYKVRRISGDQPVDIALKISARTSKVDAEYKNEADVLKKIGELAAYDIAKVDGILTHILAMEYAPGKDLFQYFYEIINQNDDREYVRIYINDRDLGAKILVGVATAVNCLHKLGYMHRDLKPENIIWDDDTCTAKLRDRGYAIVSTKGTKDFVGTPGWKGPERTKDPVGVETHLSDIWGLGVIALHILSRGAGGNWMEFLEKDARDIHSFALTHLKGVFSTVFAQIDSLVSEKEKYASFQDRARKNRKHNPQPEGKNENEDAEMERILRKLSYPETQALILAGELTNDDPLQRPSFDQLDAFIREIQKLLRNKALKKLQDLAQKEPLKKDLAKKIEEVAKADADKKELLKKSFDKESLEEIEKTQKDIDVLLKEVEESRKEKNKRSRTSSLNIPRKNSASPSNSQRSPKVSPKRDREAEAKSEIR